MFKTLCLVLAVGITPFAHAQGQLMGVTLVNSKDSPIYIVSVTGSNRHLVSSVHIKNVTDRVISSFTLGMVPLIPPGCGARPSVGQEETVDSTTTAVFNPSQTEEVSVFGSEIVKMDAFAKQGKAALVNIQLAVVSASFADGGSWRRTMDGTVYDKELETKDGAVMCNLGHVSDLVAACPKVNRSMQSGVMNSNVRLMDTSFQLPQSNISPLIMGHYECVFVASAQDCQNTSGSQNCNSAACTDPYACSYQSCYWCNVPGPCRPPK